MEYNEVKIDVQVESVRT